jgi:hypothetical protein
MNGKNAFLAVALTTGLSILGAASASAGSDNRDEGNWHDRVHRCSLDGVNPVYYPEIFGNPALAKAYYGFIRSRDGSWHVMPNCHLY